MSGDSVKPFTGSGGYGDGEQRRNFIYIEDVLNVLLWFLNHPEKSGIFNIGTGGARSFNDVARAVIATHGRGQLHYIPFPENLKGRYQSFTEADISRLRDIGYDGTFRPGEDGVALYV
jgi:ADP-L-glycero-D-manno-heptose 6-epimerase